MIIQTPPMLKAIIGIIFTQHNYYLVTFVIKFKKIDTNCFSRIRDVSLNIISEHCQMMEIFPLCGYMGGK